MISTTGSNLMYLTALLEYLVFVMLGIELLYTCTHSLPIIFPLIVLKGRKAYIDPDCLLSYNT